MVFKAYNDYELIYMVKENNDEIAFTILLKKYQNYIYKKIHQFFFYEKEYDDYFQEGVVSLIKAIQSFDQKYNKTFMRYFEVIINRDFINLDRNNKKTWSVYQSLKEEYIIHETEEIYFDFEEIKFKSALEQSVYQLYYLENKTINHICNYLNIETKQVYNTIGRIKKKLKSL